MNRLSWDFGIIVVGPITVVGKLKKIYIILRYIINRNAIFHLNAPGLKINLSDTRVTDQECYCRDIIKIVITILSTMVLGI